MEKKNQDHDFTLKDQECGTIMFEPSSVTCISKLTVI